jgi:hypothetical protein
MMNLNFHPMGKRKNVHQTNLHPSIHPSPPVSDVLPDEFAISTLLINLGDTIKKVC